MNYGGYVIHESFVSHEEIESLREMAMSLYADSTATHESGKYASKLWSEIPLASSDGRIFDSVSCPEMAKVISFFKSPLSLAVFYYLAPGGKLHPHRDLSGATLNHRIRFHIPVQTNQDVVFKVSGERLNLRPGELWALDTSHLHSAENNGRDVRVHIVIQCDVNAWCKSILKKPNLTTLQHDVFYALYLLYAAVKSLLTNSWKDPKYLRQQIRMVLGHFKTRTKSSTLKK